MKVLNLMMVVSKKTRLLIGVALLLVGAGISSYAYFTRPYYPTVHEYILETKNAEFVEALGYKIDGHQAVCGARPTVLYDDFDSWGGAYPGFIIMNPKAIKSLPTTVKLYIYYHECGHQFTGVNETKADNFAILQGLKSGWLSGNDGMSKICHFVSKIPADSVHPAGQERCKNMQIYFTELRSKPTKQ